MPSSLVSEALVPRRVGLVPGVAGALGCLLMFLVLLVPSAARASSSLVISSTDFSTLGLRPAPASVGSARGELNAGLPGGVRTLLDGALIQSSAASAPGRQWRSDAFVLRSSRVAERVLTSWRSVHRAQRIAIGAGGAVFGQESRGRAVVRVLWRDGARLGLLVLTTAGDLRKARAAAFGYTALADSFLKTPLPTTEWGRVLDQVRPDGTVSERTALEAFALAYGPVPGVPMPKGPIGAIPDGTLAAAWVLGYRARLSPRQLRVVYRLVGLPAPGRSARVAGPPDYGDPNWVGSRRLEQVARMWVSVYDAEFGIALPLSVVAGYTSTVLENRITHVKALGDAAPLDTANGGWGSGDPQICRIRVGPLGLTKNAADQSSILAHEVFHCFEFYFLGPKAWYDRPKAWIMEGLAVWGQLSVDHHAPNEFAAFMGNYAVSPHTALFTRTYDAVGFWGHVQDVYHDLWARIPSILNAGGNEPAFHNAGADTADFLNSWGSSVFNSRTAGPPWEMVSPNNPSIVTLGQVINPALVGGSQHSVAAPAYTTAQYIVGATAEPLLHVSITGSARLSFQHNYTDLHDAWFCTSDKPCVCPPRTVGAVPPTRPLVLATRLGLAGDPGTGTYGEVEAYPLSLFCHRLTPPPPSGGGSLRCGNDNCGSSGGDPHMSTFPGLSFPFQAAGEFTLVKSTTDDLEIQVREQPFGASRYVSLNTAVAMRVARATVEVEPGRPNHPIVWVNRRRLNAQGSVRLAGGGRLSELAGTTVIVTWPDGTEALLSPGAVGPGYEDGVDVALKVAPSRVGHLTGLLGDAGTADGTELVGRNGRRYSYQIANPDTPAEFALLYKSFGRSWRISQRNSLFVYPRGKDTNSYTINDFPSGAYTVETLSPPAFASAERACAAAGVNDPAVLGDCILDVGATGDPGFATGAAGLQAATGGLPASAGGVSPIGWTQLSLRPDNDPLLIASLAPAGASIVAAYARDSDGSIETASFTPTPAGVGAVRRSTPFTGWLSIGDPLLFPAPGGGLQMIFSGINNSAALSGTIIAERHPDGTFGPADNTSSGPEANLARGAVLASDGMTPVWTNTYGPFLKLERGATHPVETDLSSLVAGDAEVPTLAHDQSGRLWMAWYEIANNPAKSGLYLLELDPSGDGVAPGATPQLAPDSQTIDNLTAQPALACAAVCRLVYQDTNTNTKLESWTPGRVGPTVIASDSKGFSDPTAAYTTDGRLWITWAEPHSAVLLAKLGDATGAGGSPIRTLTPSGYSTALNTAATIRGAQLVLVTNWQTDHGTPATAVFATVISARR